MWGRWGAWGGHAPKGLAQTRPVVSTTDRNTTNDNRESDALPTFVLPACDALLLELLVAHPHYFARIHAAIETARIESDVARRIYPAREGLASDVAGPGLSQLLSEFDDPRVKNLLVGIVEESAVKPPTEPERLLQDVLSAYERRQTELHRRAALAAARQDSTSADQLLAQFCEQAKSKHFSDYERRKK